MPLGREFYWDLSHACRRFSGVVNDLGLDGLIEAASRGLVAARGAPVKHVLGIFMATTVSSREGTPTASIQQQYRAFLETEELISGVLDQIMTKLHFCGSSSEVHGFVWETLTRLVPLEQPNGAFWALALRLCRIYSPDTQHFASLGINDLYTGCALGSCFHGVGHSAFLRAVHQESRESYQEYREYACAWMAENGLPWTAAMSLALNIICDMAGDYQTIITCFGGAYHSLAQYTVWNATSWLDPCRDSSMPGLCLYNTGRFHRRGIGLGYLGNEQFDWTCSQGIDPYSDLALGCITALSFNALFPAWDLLHHGIEPCVWDPEQSVYHDALRESGAKELCTFFCQGSVTPDAERLNPNLQKKFNQFNQVLAIKHLNSSLKQWCALFMSPTGPMVVDERYLACISGVLEAGVGMLEGPEKEVFCQHLLHPPWRSDAAYQACNEMGDAAHRLDFSMLWGDKLRGRLWH